MKRLSFYIELPVGRIKRELRNKDDQTNLSWQLLTEYTYGRMHTHLETVLKIHMNVQEIMCWVVQARTLISK